MIRTNSARLSTVSMVGLALLVGIGLGIAYAPTVGVGQDGDVEEVLFEARFGELPPGAFNALGKNNIRLVRVVRVSDPNSTPKKYDIATYHRGNVQPDQHDIVGPEFVSEPNKPPFVDWVINADPGENTIDVSAKVDKVKLLFAGESGPIDVLSASVILKVGTGTRIWDCYWVGGRKVCEWINI